MKIPKLAACLAMAGALLALYGLIARADTSDATESVPPAVSAASLDPINGLAPIEDVIALFQQRSESRPNDYLSRTQLGQALSAQAREHADLEGYEAAEAVLNEALSINPQWKPAQLALAGALHSQHRFEEARDIAQVLVDTDPTSLPALAVLGDANLELGDLDLSRTLYEQLAAAERSAPVVSRLARLASLTGDHEIAVERATEALDLSEELALRPNSQAFYWFQLGRMRFEAGDVQAAVAAYERALSLDSGNAAATESLAFASAAVGDFERAAALYEVLLASGPAPDLYGSYSEVLRELGRTGEAAENETIGMALARETIDRFPAERRHLVNFLVTRDSQTAIELARADLQERHDRGAYDTLAWALYNDGQVGEAADVLARAPAGDAPYAAMLFHEAAILAEIGDDAEALRLVSAALDLNPKFHPTEATQAQALFEALAP